MVIYMIILFKGSRLHLNFLKMIFLTYYIFMVKNYLNKKKCKSCGRIIFFNLQKHFQLVIFYKFELFEIYISCIRVVLKRYGITFLKSSLLKVKITLLDRKYYFMRNNQVYLWIICIWFYRHTFIKTIMPNLLTICNR